MYKFVTYSKLHCLLRAKNSIGFLRVSSTINKTKSSNIELNKNAPYFETREKLFTYEFPSRKLTIPEQIINTAPHAVQPYLKIMRLDKPIGTWLLFWPGTWGIALAATPGTLPDPYLLTLFGVGSLIMRGAGCTINDMWDRKIDIQVARTLNRPLVNGSMSITQAWIFLAGQLSVGLCILLQLNINTIALGVSSLALVITYPLMKRITYWPQFVLGLTFNWGILMGYCASHGCLDSTCVPMYAGAICWTIVYDTIYAYQDIKDDLRMGVKSTAIRFKENTKAWLAGFSAVSISGFTFSGILTEQTWPYYSAAAIAATHLVWQIYGLNVNNAKDCGKKFASNTFVGMIIFLGIALGNFLKSETSTNCISKSKPSNETNH